MAKRAKPSKSLPLELIGDHILPRLPVKSLIRFTSVSKTWETLIKSPKFIATHFNFNKAKGKGRFPLILNSTSCYTIKNQEPIYFNKLIGSMSEYQCQLLDDFPASSCNGLVLLKGSLVHPETEIEYMLWNPCIRKSKTIESFYPRDNFHNSSSSESGYIVRGLGFHESSDDYRVVKIEYSGYRKASAQVEVYSLKKGSWRNVRAKPNGLVAFGGGVFLNGCVHWLATRKFVADEYEGISTSENSPESILYFDFEKECFGEIKLPKKLDYGDTELVSFIDYQGSLAALFSNYDHDKCFLWVMDKYGVTNSWNKKRTIKLPKKCGAPLGFTQDGMLVCEEYEQEESCYGLWASSKKQTQSLKNRKKVPGFIFLDIEKFKKPVYVVDYMESLALFDQKSEEECDDYYGYLYGDEDEDEDEDEDDDNDDDNLAL